MNWIDSIIEEHNKKLEATGWKGDWKDNDVIVLGDPLDIYYDILYRTFGEDAFNDVDYD